MKHTVKKTVVIALSALTLASSASALNVSADADNTVHVIVKNERLSVADGAPWTGTLIDTQATLNADDSIETLVERVIKDNGFEFTVSDYGYISSVNNLAEYAYNGSGGWMTTLNDWFTSEGTIGYTVENGGLKAGDEIVMIYSCSWGADVGSLYGNFDTSLQALSVDGGSLTQAFVPSQKDYTLLIDSAETAVTVVPEAYNKNYQVRMYCNVYLPVSNAQLPYKQAFSVKDGDTLYIGIGNPAWPTMNSWAGTADETVYTLQVKTRPFGDLSGNGSVGIEDATLLQRYLAEYVTFDAAMQARADIDNDGDITINDVTALQRMIAEF